jgi:hypothetical protein
MFKFRARVGPCAPKVNLLLHPVASAPIRCVAPPLRCGAGTAENWKVAEDFCERKEAAGKAFCFLPGSRAKRKSHARAWPSQNLKCFWCVINSRSCLFTSPISQMDVLLDFASLVPVFMGFIRSISGCPERILTGSEDIADYIQ